MLLIGSERSQTKNVDFGKKKHQTELTEEELTLTRPIATETTGMVVKAPLPV